MSARSYGFVCAIAASGVVANAPASAADYEVQVGGHARYEDNIFRRSKADIRTGGFSHSDTIYGLQGSVLADVDPLGFDTQISGSAGYDWYKNNKSLKNLNYDAQIRASRDTGRFGAKIDASVERRLSSFGDVRARIRNIQSYERLATTLSYAITSDLRIVATPEYSQNVNSYSLLKQSDFRQYGGGVGLGYYSPTGNSVSITVSRRQTDGLHDRLIPRTGGAINSPIDQIDTSVDLLLLYKISEFTKLEGYVSYVKRNDKSALDADYTGPSGTLSLDYSPRSSWRAKLTIGRQLSAQSYLFASAVRTDYIQLDWNILVLDRTRLDFSALHSRRKLRYDPLFSDFTTRNDRTTTFVGGVTQRIGNHVNASLSAGHDFRNSSDSNRNYRANYVMGTVSFVAGSRPWSASRL